MENRINFTGSFLIKNPPKMAKIEIEPLLGRHRQIFENFNNTSDIFYVVRPGKDRDIADFILKNHLWFKFFPKINTRSGLDPMYPKSAILTVDTANNVIKNPSILSKKFNLDYYVDRIFDKNIKGIVHALGFKMNELKIRSNGGVTYAFDRNQKHVFKASPTNKNGENYVYVNKDKGSDRYLIHGNKIVYKYPENANYFDDNFDNAVVAAMYG